MKNIYCIRPRTTWREIFLIASSSDEAWERFLFFAKGAKRDEYVIECYGREVDFFEIED